MNYSFSSSHKNKKNNNTSEDKKEIQETWSRWFWKRHDKLWKKCLKVVNIMEISSGSKVENLLNRPVTAPTDKYHNNLRKWQYRNQRNVTEQQSRSWEQLFSGMGVGVLTLGAGLRNFSPDHLHSEGNWKCPQEVSQDEIMNKVGDKLVQLPFPLHSPQGLEWLFSVRLGAWFLQKDFKNTFGASTFSSPSYDQIVTAHFTTLSTYETKVGTIKIDAQIWFSLDETNHCLKWEKMRYQNNIITSYADPKFEDASRAIMCCVVTDVSILHHALNSHLLIGDIFASATHTCLTDLKHPVRRFLQPFCYGVWDISNLVRSVLIAKDGTLNTVFSFSYEGLKNYIQDTFDNYDMSTVHVLPNFLREKGLLTREKGQNNSSSYRISSALPMWEDAYEYWKMFVVYVEELTVAAGYKCDQDVFEDPFLQHWAKEIFRQQPHLHSCPLQFPMGLADFRLLCTIFMYHSVISHEIASNANDLVTTPYAVTTMWREPQETKGCPLEQVPLEEKISTRDVSRRALIAAHTTALQVKRFDIAWGYVAYPEDEGLFYKCSKAYEVRKVMNSIPLRLKQVDDLIQERNQVRKYPNESLRSYELNCSIAV